MNTFENAPSDGNLIVNAAKFRFVFPAFQSKQVSEVHALISSSKALLTWTARDAIQEAREACGGHVCSI